MSKLFQNSLTHGVVSNAWREANITALFKKGSKSATQNYRPVSLTSVVCKLIESIIKGCNVEDDWVAFKKVIIDIRDKYIPKKEL